ncbi:MAG: hypothetical protein A3H95_06360 [Acidobacteria bacterium RIFCSPLOWO2_02_FULL_64_15]|nr:MAG: hypothetical protein A3H95_06360 [Acidobacteria bacterium RIFCSPLOWO2_02_FULL_64_15]
MILFGLVALVVFGLLVTGFILQVTTSQPDPSLLKIVGRRGLAGLELTNKDFVALSDCDVSILDGGSKWVATIAGYWRPSQTISVAWSEFKQNGQPLPGYLGRAKDNVLVSCVRTGERPERQSAGLHF